MANDKKSNAKKDLEREALVAIKRIESIRSSFKDINKRLKLIKKSLMSNIIANPATTRLKYTKNKKHQDYPFFKKNRNKLDNTPKRIWYKMHGMYFYIEFTIRCMKNDAKKPEGCFIYGTSHYNEKDKVEDKPIVSFYIDDHEIIKANDDFEDESWTCEKKDIIDLHLRALDEMWEEALYTINNGKY